jgi:hypothetical protein
MVVLSESLGAEGIKERCAPLLKDGHEIAICCALAPEMNLQASLEIQRRITTALRQVLETSAEAIPIFVVTGEAGDGVEECARAWGADVSA